MIFFLNFKKLSVNLSHNNKTTTRQFLKGFQHFHLSRLSPFNTLINAHVSGRIKAETDAISVVSHVTFNQINSWIHGIDSHAFIHTYETRNVLQTFEKI